MRCRESIRPIVLAEARSIRVIIGFLLVSLLPAATCTIWSFLTMIGNFFFPTEVNIKLFEVTLPRFEGMIQDFGGVEWLKSL